MFTTNKPVEDWGRVLHDADLAEAILDRVLERGRILQLKGPSYRTRHIQVEQRAKVSGKGVPEFPEPTASKSNASACFWERMTTMSGDGTPSALGRSVTCSRSGAGFSS